MFWQPHRRASDEWAGELSTNGQYAFGDELESSDHTLAGFFNSEWGNDTVYPAERIVCDTQSCGGR